MSRTLKVFPIDGVGTDSLGHYLVGLGLLAAAEQRWPTIRACWQESRFMLLSDQVDSNATIRDYLLTQWKPRTYERWWTCAQKSDTKAKGSAALWKERNNHSQREVNLLDAHVVGMGRNCFNPLFGTGGNIGKRDLAKAWKDSVVLLKKPERSGWLDATLTGHSGCGMPDLSSGGTWFVFANKTFNSGQGWYREGQLSPWSFLLAMEGAFLLVGGVNRRLGSRSRPYAVFPFVSEPCQPETEGEIGLARAEFWAPLWKNPATLREVETLFQRGSARLGGRAAQAPHEFAVAALGAGVDVGIAEFARYELRQTTSSQVFEAIPREHIVVQAERASGVQRDCRANASNMLLALIESGWINKLPMVSKQSRAHVGLRGKVEKTIVSIGARPNESGRWQQLLVELADAQATIDRNRVLRESCAALRPLDPTWFDLAWPDSNEIPVEIEVARAIASIGWPCDAKTGDQPILANIFGIEVTAMAGRVRVRFPKARSALAVWGNGMPLQILLDVAHRRLVDADKPASKPFAASCFCRADAIHRLLRNDGSIDLEEVVLWVPALSLIDWSRSPRFANSRKDPVESTVEPEGTIALQALVRPIFHVFHAGTRERLFPQTLQPSAGLMRRVFNLLRFNSLDEAIQVVRDRYLAAGCEIVMPPVGFKANGELVAASLLIPISDQAVTIGLRRWRQPSKNIPN